MVRSSWVKQPFTMNREPLNRKIWGQESHRDSLISKVPLGDACLSKNNPDNPAPILKNRYNKYELLEQRE